MVRIISLRLGFLLTLIGMLAACGGTGAPSAGPAPTSAPADEPAAQPAATAAPPATAARAAGDPTSQPPLTAAPAPGTPQNAATEAAEGAIAQGATPEGYHFLGQADAPVTLVMYSDFL